MLQLKWLYCIQEIIDKQHPDNHEKSSFIAQFYKNMLRNFKFGMVLC